MRRCGVALVVVLTTISAACTSGVKPATPTSGSPSTPSNWTLTGHVISTANAPVSGAAVQYAGHQATTDAAGRFTVTHQVASTSSLTLSHPSLLERRVWLTGAQTRTVALEPIALAPPFDLVFYRQFVRNDFEEPGQFRSVRRWTEAPKFYIQTTDVNGSTVDAATVQTVIDAIHEGVSALTPFTASVETGPAARAEAAGWVNVYFETRRPDGQTTCGRATIGGNQGWMRFWLDACRVPGDPGRLGRWIVLHEVGHSMGFWHAPPGYLMHGLMNRAAPRVTDTERFHARIAYTRPVGNTDPDHDPASGAFSLAQAGPAPVVSCHP